MSKAQNTPITATSAIRAGESGFLSFLEREGILFSASDPFSVRRVGTANYLFSKQVFNKRLLASLISLAYQ